MVDLFQACVSFNKINTFKWFKEHTYYLEAGYDPTDRAEAFKKALETDHMPLGVIYVNKNRLVFEDNLRAYKENKIPLYKRENDFGKIEELIRAKK